MNPRPQHCCDNNDPNGLGKRQGEVDQEIEGLLHQHHRLDKETLDTESGYGKHWIGKTQGNLGFPLQGLQSGLPMHRLQSRDSVPIPRPPYIIYPSSVVQEISGQGPPLEGGIEHGQGGQGLRDCRSWARSGAGQQKKLGVSGQGSTCRHSPSKGSNRVFDFLKILLWAR